MKRKKDKAFVSRLFQHLPLIHRLFGEIYALHPEAENQFLKLIQSLIQGYQNRENALRKRDEEKAKKRLLVSQQSTHRNEFVCRSICGRLEIHARKAGLPG
ncbi:hypothetical protein [Algoriphagus boritolerans]|uniref:hypothetical protein n=1 Tax=Algoriphagus boritolerans TaxID=308111 RepID=UPI002FCE1A07